MKPRLVGIDGREIESPAAAEGKLVEKVAAAMDFIDAQPLEVAHAALALRRAKRQAAYEALVERGREQLRIANEACEELYRLRDPSRWVGELGKLDPSTRDVVRTIVANRLTWDAAQPRYTTDGARYA